MKRLLSFDLYRPGFEVDKKSRWYIDNAKEKEKNEKEHVATLHPSFGAR